MSVSRTKKALNSARKKNAAITLQRAARRRASLKRKKSAAVKIQRAARKRAVARRRPPPVRTSRSSSRGTRSNASNIRPNSVTKIGSFMGTPPRNVVNHSYLSNNSAGSLYFGSNGSGSGSGGGFNFRQCKMCDETALTGGLFCLECSVERERRKLMKKAKSPKRR